MPQRTCKSCRVLVGLEIHVQLATRSKMFTGAANAFGAEPNSLVDPQVLGLPGVLPVMNRSAVEHAIKVGMALGCEVSPFTKWDRKSYYYPDLPKNYQISQYDLPLCHHGMFEIPGEDGAMKRIRIRRAHLEEDAGKLLHDAPGGHRIDYTIVDLNRAGTPLLEIVTEPDLSSAREVTAFAQRLQKLVQYLGASHGQMQMGHMRFEPNINLHITDQEEQVHRTAITEIKNLNSFSVLERATDYEIRRQLHEWAETGWLGRKSTRGWDEASEATFLQREKEEAQDYRYFPDPDLCPVVVDEVWLTELKGQIGELPAAREKRYLEYLKLAPKDVEWLTAQRATGDYLDALVSAGVEPKRACNIIEALREIEAMGHVTPERAMQVSRLIESGKVAANKDTTKAILRKMAEAQSIPAAQAATELGLMQSSDTGAIDAAIDALLAQKPKAMDDFKAGKQQALGALVGAVMKSTKGLSAKLVQERLRERLS